MADQNKANEKPLSRISVRTLVEFVLREGDIDRRVRSGFDLEAARAGAVLHRKLQKKEGAEYTAEEFLSCETEYEDLVLRVEGRADGVIRTEGRTDGAIRTEGQADGVIRTEGQADGVIRTDGKITVDEIKGMYLDVKALEEPFAVHLAQAKCYAHMLCLNEGAQEITVRMTYVNLETEEMQRFFSVHKADELAEWFRQVTDVWYRFARWEKEHRAARDASMKQLTFPFPYRQGQKKLTAAVYHTIRDGGQLFLMAPTGVGKTMSCVYPSVRALGEGLGERIFYLTAKNETLRVGKEAFSILMDRGLVFRMVQLTSREKICPMSEVSCNPDDCPYAKGHFDRVNEALYDLLLSDRPYDRDFLARFAEERKVCPFELTLDLAVWCDAVLCDYNYVFDPNARLRRFFGGGRNGCIFLIDEAHNLVERGRDMYSAQIAKEEVLAAKKALGEADPQVKKLLSRLNRQLLTLRKQTEEEPDGSTMGRNYRMVSLGEMQPFQRTLLALAGSIEDMFQKKKDGALKEKFLEFYFQVLSMNAAAEYLDENYRIYAGEDEDGHFVLKLFCVRPAARLTEALEGGCASVLFSATLLPIGYYTRLLTTREDAYAVYAESPFETEKRLLLIGSDVTTRYSSRGEELYGRIADYIYETASGKVGNYLAFFPSYRMMRQVFAAFRERYEDAPVNYVCQASGMIEMDREIFLENFYEDPKESLVGFVVMGGMFAEGLDLTGTRLIGAIVAGAGIPQVSNEREILKKVYDETDGAGFDYAYRFPGINKVEQAAGRVIRTAEDRGVIVLLDGRLLAPSYRTLFPREWSDAGSCTLADVGEQVRRFWESRESGAEP